MTICKIVKEIFKNTNRNTYKNIKDMKPCCCMKECMYNFDLYYKSIGRQTKSKKFWEKLELQPHKK